MDDSRDYILINKIKALYSILDKEELDVAYNVIKMISDHLYKKHFRDKDTINVRALVKSFEDLNKIGRNMLD